MEDKCACALAPLEDMEDVDTLISSCTCQGNILQLCIPQSVHFQVVMGI